MAIFEGERIFGMLTILLVRRDSVSRAAFHPGVRSVAACMSFGKTLFRLPRSAARKCYGGCRRRNARAGGESEALQPRRVRQTCGVCLKHGAREVSSMEGKKETQILQPKRVRQSAHVTIGRRMQDGPLSHDDKHGAREVSSMEGKKETQTLLNGVCTLCSLR